MHRQHEIEKMKTQEEIKKAQEEMKQAQEEMKKLQDHLAAQKELLRIETEAFQKKQEEILAQKEAAEKESERLQKESERLREEAKRKEKPPVEVQEEGHEHPLKLVTYVYKKGQYMCDKCNQRGSGQVYHCDICRFDMHPSCTVDYVTWQGTRPALPRPISVSPTGSLSNVSP